LTKKGKTMEEALWVIFTVLAFAFIIVGTLWSVRKKK